MCIDALRKIQDISPKWADIRQDSSVMRNDKAMNLNFTLILRKISHNINIAQKPIVLRKEFFAQSVSVETNASLGAENGSYKTISLGYCLLRESFITGIEDQHLFSFKRRLQANLEIIFETAYSLLSFLHFPYQSPLHQIPPEDLRSYIFLVAW